MTQDFPDARSAFFDALGVAAELGEPATFVIHEAGCVSGEWIEANPESPADPPCDCTPRTAEYHPEAEA